MATTSAEQINRRQTDYEGNGRDVFELALQCQLQAHLGRNLQAAYRAVVEEPLPERLLKLLDGLKRKEKLN
jgi:hypothetical protein